MQTKTRTTLGYSSYIFISAACTKYTKRAHIVPHPTQPNTPSTSKKAATETVTDPEQKRVPSTEAIRCSREGFPKQTFVVALRNDPLGTRRSRVRGIRPRKTRAQRRASKTISSRRNDGVVGSGGRGYTRLAGALNMPCSQNARELGQEHAMKRLCRRRSST